MILKVEILLVVLLILIIFKIFILTIISIFVSFFLLMPKHLKKHIKKLFKKKIHKKLRSNEDTGTYNHNKYYQNLYQNYLRDTAKDQVEHRNLLRDTQLDEIKHRIGVLNNRPRDNNQDREFRKLTSLQSLIQNEKARESQAINDMKLGNNLDHPIAANNRELDDQHLFGSMLYQSLNRPNYEDLVRRINNAKIAANNVAQRNPNWRWNKNNIEAMLNLLLAN